MKKLISLIILFLLLITIYIIFLFIPKDYITNYEVKDVNIKEEYNKKDKYYYFVINYKDIELEYLFKSKYINNHKLINNIIINKDNIILKSNYIDNIKLCYASKQIMCENSNNSQVIDTYNNINIYNKVDKIYIWNYKGFIDINNKKEINILNNEIYIPKLITKINNYLMIPDYDNEYYFNKIYYLDILNNKIKNYSIKYNIYYDSYILGTNNKSIYLMDKKNKQEYEIVVHKEKIRINNNKLFINNEWNNIYNEEIINQNKIFTYNNLFNYEIDNNQLYLHYLNSNNKLLISDNVTYLVDVIDDSVYYLVEDTLYKFNMNIGNIKILDYFNFNFNYKNLIYIYV